MFFMSDLWLLKFEIFNIRIPAIIYFCILALSCQRLGLRPGTASAVLVNTSQITSSSPLAPRGGDYIVGDQQSIEAFAKWTPQDRALMLISADNGIYNQQNPMEPRRLPYVRLKPASISFKSIIQKHPSIDRLQKQFKDMERAFSKGSCDDILVPYHPDTKAMHPAFNSFKNINAIQGATLRGSQSYPDFIGFNSMSRSMFVLNQKNSNSLPLLSSLKVGSDTVMGTYQPEKMTGVFWNARYVNALSEPTSVHELAESNGIAVVSDSVGIEYLNNYGVVLRDYSLLVDEKDYFFMPLMAFQERLLKKSPLAENNAPLFWNLYKPAKAKIYDNNSKILRLALNSTHLEKIVEELAFEMGKLISIYYLNGISSIDLHGQNLLVGIPLNPERQAMIAVRDISDHWVFPYVSTNFAQLKYGAIPEPDWCQPLYLAQGAGDLKKCQEKIRNLTKRGFESIVTQTGFDFSGVDIQSLESTKEIYNLMLSKPEKFKDQILSVRNKFKSVGAATLPKLLPRASRCLRSLGCPLARSVRLP
jgi:hypothetical protein